MRELVIMAEAKQKSNWEIASAQMCLLANINRSGKTKTFKPADFNPFASRKKTDGVIHDNQMALDALKKMANGRIRRVKK